MSLLPKPFLLPVQSPPQLSDNNLRLMIQCSRHGGKLVLDYTNRDPRDHSGILGRAVDPDGMEHRRSTVKSWGARGMFRVTWCGHVATVELTDAGIKWLYYLRDLLNEVPL